MKIMENSTPPLHVSVVIPCYRSSSSIDSLVHRLVGSIEPSSYALECVLVDDCSPDEFNTWATLRGLAAEFPGKVSAIRLARNVGQHNAILCGISHISSEAQIVVTMDDDLQQLPEDVSMLLDALVKGADIAIGAYPHKKHAPWRNLGGSIVDGTLRRIFKLPGTFQLTSLRAFKRYAADEVVECKSRYTYLTAALLSVTRKRVNVQVAHETRKEGRSGYSLPKSIELALNLFLTYSRIPIYLIFSLFMASIAITATITLWAFIKYLTSTQIPMGWTSQMIMVGTCSTLNLAAIAVVALFATRSHRLTAVAHDHWRIAERA